MIEHCKTWPSTEGHKNLLLYEDSDDDFVVNAIVRTPSRASRIHDHAHAWTAYGFVDGIERLERSRRLDAAKRADYAVFDSKASAASAKRASRGPRWIALISPIGGILLLDSKQIIRTVFLRLQCAILVTVLK
jgi:hypothetical protein